MFNMYKQKAVLVGCNQDILQDVRRHLLNLFVQVEGSFTDISSAIGGLRFSPAEMRFFIVHAKLPADIPQLKRLTSTFIGRPMLIVVEGDVSTNLILGAMRAGANQVLTLPLQKEDLQSAIDCVEMHFGSTATDSKTVAVSGVSGGCGGTTLAVNLAFEMSDRCKQKSLLVDLALQMGSVTAHLNIEPRFTLDDLLGSAGKLDSHIVEQALVPYNDWLSVLAGPREPIPRAVAPETILHLLDLARRSADLVVLDVPCTFEDLYFDILGTANKVVLVAEQRIPAIRNLKLVMDTLQRSNVTQSRYGVLNRYEPNLKGFAAKDLEKYLELPELFTIANDQTTVANAINCGQLLRQVDPGGRVLADIDKLARKLLDDYAGEPAADTASLLGRVARALGLA